MTNSPDYNLATRSYWRYETNSSSFCFSSIIVRLSSSNPSSHITCLKNESISRAENDEVAKTIKLEDSSDVAGVINPSFKNCSDY